jgi:hypothetical protein
MGCRNRVVQGIMSRALSLVSVPEAELLERLSTLVDRHRRCEAELVAHLAEVDARELYLGKACSSMFSYATEVLHLSEHEAYLRIACARASRRFPVLLDMLADGRLHLSAIAKLAPHLTEEGAEALLARAVHRTKREVEELVAEVAPRPDVAASMRKLPRTRRGARDQLGPNLVPGATASDEARSTTATSSATTEPAATAARVTHTVPPAVEQTGPEVGEAPAARAATMGSNEPARAAVEPIAPARYKVQFTASAELCDKLERAKALLRHKNPGADLAEVVDEALTVLLAKLEGRRFGTTDKPTKTLAETDTSASSRYVPAAVRRTVVARDQGQCTFVDEATGRRCSCTDPGQLEFHHLTPFARGADHAPEQIQLRCRAHNVYQAELDFGPETMKRYHTGSSRAREPEATYSLRTRAPAPEQRLVRSRQAEAPTGEPHLARRRRSPWRGLRAPPTGEAPRSRGRLARDVRRARTESPALSVVSSSKLSGEGAPAGRVQTGGWAPGAVGATWGGRRVRSDFDRLRAN